jgi:site-specific recombinase XerD
MGELNALRERVDALTTLVGTVAQCTQLLNGALMSLVDTLPQPYVAPLQSELPPTISRDPLANFIDLHSVFLSWEREHRASQGAPTTIRAWAKVVRDFEAINSGLSIDEVTVDHIRAFREAMLVQGLSPRTVRSTYLAALKAIFAHGVERGMLKRSPFSEIRMKRPRFETRQKMHAFSDQDAKRLLDSALRERRPLLHFVPWLTALTGSRVATMVNLRGCDVVELEGVIALRITRDAGPVKTSESERIVPLPQALITLKFMEFVQERGEGRLFYDDKNENSDQDELARYNPGRIAVKTLTRWVHSLNLEIGRDKGVAPNHAWRHWFREKATALGILEKVTDAIVGHAPASASRAYGSVSLATMKEAMDKIEREFT